MLAEVKEYRCVPRGYTPTNDDIIEAIKIAKDTNCIVKISWFVNYNGEYARFIYPESTFEEIKETLPKIYGM